MEARSKNLNINEFLDRDQSKDLIRILTAGSVDDGKSTLIGRLMYDSKILYEDQITTLKKDSKRVGHAGDEIDYALLLDGLKAEREQGITIDVAYRYFSTNKRKFIIADTPGHEQYTRNMVTGASTANLAIILIDATKGVITQTKRHTFIVSLLGIKHVVLAVNKMDLVDFSEQVFDDICSSYKKFVSPLGIPDINFIPLSALKGDNVVDISGAMPWYHGKSMMEFIENLHVSSDRNYEDFRFPVQYVQRPDKDFRGFSARVMSGVVRKGDEILALPSRKRSKVKQVIVGSEEKEYAFPPQSATITLEDEIDLSRGEMLVHPDSVPKIERHFESMLVWMDEKPMDPSVQYFLKQNTSTIRARIDHISYKTDINTLEREEVERFNLNDIGRVVITCNKPIIFDPYKRNRNTGAFVLIDPITNNTSAVGMIIDKRGADKLESRITAADRDRIDAGKSLISADDRIKRNGQKGMTLWLTGLHGSGKNELAYILEKKLFDLGAHCVLLDGSSTRSGLSKELDHSPADRTEHLRRIAHIARILNDQGIIAICSFISPDEGIRDQVADIIGRERFKLLYMDADLEFSRSNRPILYELAEEGKIINLPGFDVDYEIPSNPDMKLSPGADGEKLDTILDLIKDFFPLA